MVELGHFHDTQGGILRQARNIQICQEDRQSALLGVSFAQQHETAVGQLRLQLRNP